MECYRVTWEIDLDAENEIDAAIKALQMLRDKTSAAYFFNVRKEGEKSNQSKNIDLLALREQMNELFGTE